MARTEQDRHTQLTGTESLFLDKLLVRKQFLAVARSPKKHASRGLVLQAKPFHPDYLPKNNADIRFGLTTTKKIGNAVVRNRARRRLRHLAREILPTCAKAGHDYVLIARFDTANRPWDQLKQDLLYCLKKVDCLR